MSRDEFADQLLRSGAVPRQPSWVRRHFSKGRVLRTTLLVGHPHGIAALHRQLQQQPRHDYRVIGCCLSAPGPSPGLPVLGNQHDVVDVVRRYDVDTVAVLASTGWDGAALRRLESDLAPTRADLVLASAATGSVRPPVGSPDGGLRSPPRSERPALRGVHGMGKASFDRAVAALVLVLLAPVLLAVSVCVKATSRGPVLVRLPRVGRDGRPFHLLQFRTTVTRTEGGRHPAVDRPRDGRTEIGPASGETPLGAALRRCSIDELPQLLNVLKGDMSIVGPRPDRPSGATRLGADEHRHFPVKPGLTGLVRVGRPGGPREDGCMAVADYVENWSLRLDLSILRTALANVLRGSGVP